MADSTTRYSFPYLEPGDPPDIAGGLQDLAEAVETSLGSVEDETASKTYEKPLCRLVQQSAQSLTSAADTAITFGTSSEDIDTHGFHSEVTNNTRITPNVAGYYKITGTVFFAASSSITSAMATISKNGTVQPPRVRAKPDSQNWSTSVQVSMIQRANGTTDYFELLGTQSSAGAVNTNVGGSFASVFEVEFLRDL